jgi:hypothetical protein
LLCFHLQARHVAGLREHEDVGLLLVPQCQLSVDSAAAQF